MTNPHEVDPQEDPERHVGEVLADPWEMPPAVGVAAIPDPPVFEQAVAEAETAPRGWFEAGSVSLVSDDPRDSWPGY